MTSGVFERQHAVDELAHLDAGETREAGRREFRPEHPAGAAELGDEAVRARAVHHEATVLEGYVDAGVREDLLLERRPLAEVPAHQPKPLEHAV